MSDAGAGWVAIALLGKTRGNRGEVTALALSGKPERYQALREVYLFGRASPERPQRYEVESTWFHAGTLIFKFRGVDSISDAERLAGAEVRVPIEPARAARSRRILPFGPGGLRGGGPAHGRIPGARHRLGGCAAARACWWWMAV